MTIAVIVSTFSLGAQESEAAAHAQRAQAAIAANNPQAARSELQDLLKRKPRDVNALASLGMVEFTMGQYPDAIVHLKAALTEAPALWNAAALLGMCELHSLEIEAGRLSLERALPHLSDARLRVQASLELINSYWNAGLNEKAARILTLLLEKDPQNPDALYAAYRIYSTMAGGALQQLSQAAPNSARLHQVLGDAALTQEDYTRAEREYREALQLDPRLVGLHLGLGQAIAAQVKSPEQLQPAKTEFEAELQIDPQNAEAYYHLGEIAEKTGQLANAAKLLAESVHLRPSFAEPYVELAKLASDRGDDQGAARHLEKAVTLAPGNRTAHYRLAQLYKRQGETRRADAEFEAARRLAEAENRTSLSR